MLPDPDLFGLWREVDVRFKDIDLGGHAHHSQVLVYFEEARARYWHEVTGMESAEDVDFIMAEARVRYHARILYPARLSVGVRVASLGRKHFVMEYLVRSAEGKPLASGDTTMLMYDYEGGKTKRIPDETRQAILRHEGERLRDQGNA